MIVFLSTFVVVLLFSSFLLLFLLPSFHCFLYPPPAAVVLAKFCFKDDDKDRMITRL